MTQKIDNSDSTRILPSAGPLAGGLLLGSALLGMGIWALGPRSRAPAPTPQEEVRAPERAVPPAVVEVEVPVAPVVPAPEPEPAFVIAADDAEAGVDYLGAAETALEAGDLEEALLALRRHLAVNPASFDVLLRIGRFARTTKALELSEAALEQAAELMPEEPEVYLQLAQTRLAAGAYPTAAEAAERFVALSPNEAIGFNLLGRAEMARSRWEPAEIAFERGIQLDPTHPHLFNNLGLLRIRSGDPKGAVEALEVAVDQFGEEVPAYTLNNLGLAYEMVDELEAAREAFEDALAASPLYVKARLNVRRVQKALVEREEAMARRVAGAALVGADPEAPEADPMASE